MNFSGDNVLFGSYDQYLYCLSTEDGSLIWKFETEGYVHGTPTIVNDVEAQHPASVLVAGCDGYLRIINVHDGVERKKIELGDYVGASAAVLKDRAYVGTFGSQILGIDLQKAKILWRYEHPKYHFPFYASAAVTDDLVVVGGRDKLVHALKPQTGKLLWTFAARSRDLIAAHHLRPPSSPGAF